MICCIPNLICAFILLLVIPESPKFTFAQGDEAKTLKILQKMYQMNTGNVSEEFEISLLKRNEEFCKKSQFASKGFLRQMKSQTMLLFSGSNCKNILTACFIQFTLCYASNGFKTFFPEIFNKVTLWTNNETFQPATLCEIYSSKLNKSEAVVECVHKLEIEAYLSVYESRIGSLIGFILLSMFINFTGKLVLIEVVIVSAAVSSFLLIFVNIPMVSFYLFLMLLISNLAITVVNASTIEIFPTEIRFARKFKS